MNAEDYAKDLTDKELKEEYLMFDSMIHQSECYSPKDLLTYELLGKELDKRGYSIEKGYKTPKIIKG